MLVNESDTITRHYGVVSRGPRGPVDLGFGPTGAERRPRRPGDVCLAPTVAERRPNPPLINAIYLLTNLFISYKIYVVLPSTVGRLLSNLGVQAQFT